MGMSSSRLRNAAPWQRLVVVSILAFSGFSLWARFGWACSCAGNWERSDADVIFQGQVVEVHEPMHLRFSRPRGVTRIPWQLWFKASDALDPGVRTVFRVNKVWKGAASQLVTVSTGSGWCCDCSLGKIFDDGKDYVVYAVRRDGELRIGFCAGSALSGKALPSAEEAKLGHGTPPASGHSFPMFWRHLLLPGALAAPLLLAAMIWQRSRR